MEVNEDLDTEKKIEKSRYHKKDISISTKRVLMIDDRKVGKTTRNFTIAHKKITELIGAPLNDLPFHAVF